jgi:hypothetical protein
LLVAEQSRFNLAGRIDHFWACDVCGTEFETSIDVSRRAVARNDVRWARCRSPVPLVL